VSRIVSDYQARARESILRAALNSFLERGYRETTMTEIARRVGVTRGDLYHYFPSKAAMLRKIGSNFPSQFQETLTRSFAEADSSEKLADAIMQAVGDGGRTETRLWFDMMAESGNDKETEAVMRQWNRDYLGAVQAALSQLRPEATRAHSRGSRPAAMPVMFLIQGALVNLRMGTPRKLVRAAVLQGIEAILQR
jgi:AcrR family transcriptional regulator